MPFSPEQFFDVFGRYNTAVWPVQVVLYALGLVAVVLRVRGGRRNSRTTAAILAFLWLWMGIAYHLVFFRQINPAATLFAGTFVLQAAILFWTGVVRADLAFAGGTGRSRIAGYAILAYGLIAYPILNVVFGHVYPRMPTFGLPCPTTIFTFGLLLFAAGRTPRIAFVIPVLWAVVGTFAASTLGMREDFGLPAAALTAIAFSGVIVPRSKPEIATPQRTGAPSSPRRGQPR